MDFELCLYTKKKPEIDSYLVRRFEIDANDDYFGIDCGNYGGVSATSLISGNRDGNYGVIGLSDEATNDFHPRIRGEPRVEFSRAGERGLPFEVVAKIKHGNDRLQRLFASPTFYSFFEETYGFTELPRGYERFFKVLEWSEGNPVYYSHFSTGSRDAAINMLGLVRFFSNRYEGIVWDPENQRTELPSVQMIESWPEPRSLYDIVMPLLRANDKPHLKLV